MNDLLPVRSLGTTGIQVSCLGLGTVKFGRNTGVKYPSQFDIPDDNSIRNILDIARELGVNLLDTAPAYGSSEERLGRLMGPRDNWVLSSKAGEEYVDGKSHFDFSAKHIRRSIERSLRRLGTDYLDLLLVHSDGNDEHIIHQTDCFAALERCREQGLIRATGMSTKTVNGGLAALEVTDVVMVTCNHSHHDDIPVIQRAAALDKGVLVKKALDSGHGAGTATDTDTAHDPVQSSMDFVFAQPGVTSVVIGSINPLHMQHNARAVAQAIARLND